MIATEETSLEGYSEVKDLIEEGGKYFNKHVICSSDLFESLMFENGNLDIQSTKRHIILKKLGYSALPKPIKIDGKARRVWAKKSLTNEKVRELLDEEL